MNHCRPWLVALAVFVASLLLSSAGAAAACVGDCDESGEVTVDELVSMINIALGNVPITRCGPGDANQDGLLTVDEIVRAVNLSLEGCPRVTPTPSATATPSATPTPQGPFGATFSFDFRNGDQGWQADFAEYPAAAEASFALVAELRPIPPETGLAGDGLFLSGNNLSGDLFQYLTIRLGPSDGLQANQAYRLSFRVRLASNAPTGCLDPGGAPGESVVLKVGGSPRAPLPFVDDAGYVRVDLDKGNQATSGSEMSVVGNIANGIACNDADPVDPDYVSLQLLHEHPTPVRSNDAGEVWVVVGTDSGYEGTTALYYQRISVTVSAVAGD